MTLEVERIRVLHVDDDPELLELAAEFLETEDERITVETAVDIDTALDRLESGEFDCVISDYDMPETNGIEFLQAVRAEHDTLPFVLFTGKGSEAIASEAISAGVTDYLQKGVGSDQYTVLANRVTNATTNYRRRQKLSQYSTAVETAGDAIYALDTSGYIRMVNREFAETFGISYGELVGSHVSDYLSEETVVAGTNAIIELLNDETQRTTAYVFEETGPDGETRIYENTVALIDETDADVAGSVGVIHDITDQCRRIQAIERQNQQLEEFTDIVSHDLRGPLNRARSLVTEARKHEDTGQLSAVETSLQRVQEVASTLQQLTTSDEPIGSGMVEVGSVATAAWRDVETEAAELKVDLSTRVRADEDRLHELFASLFSGTVGRRARAFDFSVGSASGFAPGQGALQEWQPVRDTVRVGPLEQIHTATRAGGSEVYGFYVEDEGSEMTETLRNAFSGQRGGPPGDTGPWVSAVKEVAIAHGWEVYVTETETGGCRIEFEGITTEG